MFDLADVFTSAGITALVQVILIDLMLAGDNVVVLGTLASGLPPAQRKRVLAIGVGAALLFRLGFTLIATQLLGVIGLLFAGGLLLLWVAWRLYRELSSTHHADADAAALKPPKSFARAAVQVAIADLSMSLDNVLAVAGAAREHPAVLLFGLLLSVALMGVAANLIAALIERRRWVAYIGLAVILYVAGSMIYQGWIDRDVGIMRLFAR